MSHDSCLFLLTSNHQNRFQVSCLDFCWTKSIHCFICHLTSLIYGKIGFSSSLNYLLIAFHSLERFTYLLTQPQMNFVLRKTLLRPDFGLRSFLNHPRSFILRYRLSFWSQFVLSTHISWVWGHSYKLVFDLYHLR